MAFLGNPGLSSIAGVVGGGIGAYLGYQEAETVANLQPWQGAAILGVAGFVLGSAGAFILKSASQFLFYVLLVAILAFTFRTPIYNMTGVDPVSATLNTLEKWGVPMPEAIAKYKKMPAQPVIK